MVSAEPDQDLAQATDPQDLHQRFVSRWVSAGGQEDAADRELAAWPKGGYGVRFGGTTSRARLVDCVRAMARTLQLGMRSRAQSAGSSTADRPRATRPAASIAANGSQRC
jgi:hypothetical protein